MLKDMDFEVKSHMSVVSEDMLNAITRKIQEEKQSSIAEVKRQKAKKIAESKVIPLDKKHLKIQVEAVVAVVEAAAVVDRGEVRVEAVEGEALDPIRLWRPQPQRKKMVRVVAASAEGSAIVTQCRTCAMG